MRSGKGRHRRPRQAPAILVTAGVTSAGIATSLLGASGAQAVEATTWDKVAKCESGGVWSLNGESGYYGGLQLTLKTWEKYGGTVFAERPDLASRMQQIEVAEKILAAEGPQAWPSCAVSSGLEEEANESPDLELPLPDPDNDDSDEDADDGKGDDEDSGKDGDKGGDKGEDGDKPGDTDDADKGERPGDTDESDDSDDAPAPPGDTSVPSPDKGEKDDRNDKGDSDGKNEKDDKADEDDVPVDPDDPDDPYAGIPADRLETPGADKGKPSDDDTSDDSDKSKTPEAPENSTPGSGKHRGKPDPAERDRDQGADHGRPDRSDRGDRHLVETGDTLSSIAEKHDLTGGWPALYETNESAVGGNPNLILPGQLLQLGEQDDETEQDESAASEDESDKAGTTATR